MMFRIALGQCLAHAATKSRTMPALTLNKSSRLIPGFRGIPAGITTKCAPESAAPSCAGPVNPRTVASELTWLTSAATPATLAMSYRCRCSTSAVRFRSRLRGWPIPPAAPSTATVNPGLWCAGTPRAGSTWFASARTRRRLSVTMCFVRGCASVGRVRRDVARPHNGRFDEETSTNNEGTDSARGARRNS